MAPPTQGRVEAYFRRLKRYMKTNPALFSSAYYPVVRKTLVVQVILGLLAAFMLDGGIMFRVVGVAILGFWVCVAIVMFRRPQTPTRFDLALVQWGFWFVLAIATIRQMLA